MSYLLIATIILLYSFQTLFCVLYTKHYPGRKEMASPVFCVLEGVTIAVVSLLFIGFRFSPSPVTWIIGLLNAVVLWGYNTFLIKAGAKGSYAFMNVSLLFGGLLLPLIYNVAFLDGTIRLLQIIAVLVMLAAFVLMNAEDIRLHGTPKIYYLFCFLLFLCNGLYSIFLKMQSVCLNGESTQMIIITYAGMGILSLPMLLLREKKKTLATFQMSRKALIPLIVCLISASLAINVLVYVLPLVDLTVLYTVENGGVMILSVLYSFVFFKEKLTVLKEIGVLLAVGSMIVLSV